MRMFNNVKGYATQGNALKKLRDVLGADLRGWWYTIAVNESGRFVPVVHGNADGRPYAMLAHCGICVSG